MGDSCRVLVLERGVPGALWLSTLTNQLGLGAGPFPEKSVLDRSLDLDAFSLVSQEICSPGCRLKGPVIWEGGCFLLETMSLRGPNIPQFYPWPGRSEALVQILVSSKAM